MSDDHTAELRTSPPPPTVVSDTSNVNVAYCEDDEVVVPIPAENALPRASAADTSVASPPAYHDLEAGTTRTPPPQLQLDATHLTPTKVDAQTSCRENGNAVHARRHVSGSSSVGGSSTTPTVMMMENRRTIREVSVGSITVDYPDTEIEDEVSLVYQRHERIPMKDFTSEVRATLDVENFIERAQLALDLPDTTLDTIFDSMLHNLLDRDEPPGAVSEAKRALFTHDSVHHLAKTIQSSCGSSDYGYDYDQSWLCVLCSIPSAQKRHVLIARLKNPANLGRTSQEVHFIILVIVPTKEKDTKNALETGRTFATLFSDMDLRSRLMAAYTEEEFKNIMWEHSRTLMEEKKRPSLALSSKQLIPSAGEQEKKKWMFARDLRLDFWRRWHYYISDYVDGLRGYRTLYKSISTTVFLYFACILPSIALGVLNDTNTNGDINVKKVIYSQFIGGIFFALFSGQPMIVLLTTAPLALYTKVVYIIAKDNDIDFLALYACTGLFNAFFLIVYAVTGASRLMKWSTRSTEEIFALFISVAFTVDACKDIYHDFERNYHSTNCTSDDTGFNSTTDVATTAATTVATHSCFREGSLLFLLLALGTVWLGLLLFKFTKTPYLNAGKRQLLADFALTVAVVVASFFGSYVFKEINIIPFSYDDGPIFQFPDFKGMSATAILGSMGLGFSLSLLFFMDQNISGAMVNSPDNRLKKGPAYHWDLLVVALINGTLTLLGMPMVHGALPHSPMHVLAMAEVEDRVDQGHVHQRVIFVRETRITGLLSHVLIGLSLLLLPYPLAYIPRPVLDGLFLYLAITALANNQMFDRITLLVTEQAQYPPTHYVSRVPQRKLHLFTMTQLIQLAVMCAVGFAPIPYVKMVFPVIILLLLPIRHKFIPLFVERKYLNFLDGH